MARRTARPTPTAEQLLAPVTSACIACGHRLHLDYSNYRTVTALTRYTLRIGRCRHAPCDPFGGPSAGRPSGWCSSGWACPGSGPSTG